MPAQGGGSGRHQPRSRALIRLWLTLTGCFLMAIEINTYRLISYSKSSMYEALAVDHIVVAIGCSTGR